MKVHLYERLWMWAAAVIIAVFLVVIGVSTYAYNVHPPSHVETIDPSQIFEDPRFKRVGELVAGSDGALEVQMVASMFAFTPSEVRVPAGRPVRFRLTSADVVHGFMVSGTNANAMLVPGYVTQFTTVFPRAGDYLVVCHEFCGNGHHAMFGRIIVEESPMTTSDLGAPAPTATGQSFVRLALANIGVSIAAFGLASAMAMMQALSRANLDLPFRSAGVYYMSVTAHGTLMALVFTTFFIMGFGYVVAQRALGAELPLRRTAWISFWIAVLGTSMTVVAILAGKATVLYTFYPPLKAHPAFYIGLTLVVVGSWGWSGVMLYALRLWRRLNPGRTIPLAMYGYAATIIVWALATIGVAAEMLLQLIPWSLGWSATVDPVLARILFWWFGHPLVYLWLLPAYVVWYTLLPAAAGGRLFSAPLGRLVFAMFILLSTPVGFHHQFMDPGIPSQWKLFHTINTLLILYPSFVTAFTIIASLEIAGRMRGGTGVFGWIPRLPWGDPLVSSAILSMLLFAIGGFGGAINASFGLNAMVHNTSWIPGHFHTTVGSASALTFMGACYLVVPRLLGRQLELAPMARVQPYLWFFGMLLFSIPTHITGLMGMPRRVYDATYGEHPVALSWRGLTDLSAVGGIVLFASALFFVLVMVFTLAGTRAEARPLEFAESVEPEPARGSWLDRLGLLTLAAAALIVIAYAYPIWHHLQMPRFGSPGFSPF